LFFLQFRFQGRVWACSVGSGLRRLFRLEASGFRVYGLGFKV
jgi:hypothetical protein